MKTPLWIIVGIVAGIALAFGSSIQTAPTASACILFCDEDNGDDGDGLLDGVLEEDDGLLDIDILEDEDDGDDGFVNVDVLNDDDDAVDINIDTDEDGGDDLADLEVDTDLLDDDEDGTDHILEVVADTSLLGNDDDEDVDLHLEIIRNNGNGSGNVNNLLQPVTGLLSGGNDGSNGDGNNGGGDNGLIDLGDDQLLDLCLGIDPLDLLALAGEGCLQDNSVCTLLNLNCLLGDQLEPVIGPDGTLDPLIDLCIGIPLVDFSLEVGQGCRTGDDDAGGPGDGDDGSDGSDGDGGNNASNSGNSGNGGNGGGNTATNRGNGGGNTVTNRGGANPIAASAPISRVQGAQGAESQRAGNFTVPNAGDGGLLGLKDGTTSGIAAGALLFATLLGLIAASRALARIRG